MNFIYIKELTKMFQKGDILVIAVLISKESKQKPP